jgi:hypothetical protein
MDLPPVYHHLLSHDLTTGSLFHSAEEAHERWVKLQIYKVLLSKNDKSNFIWLSKSQEQIYIV